MNTWKTANAVVRRLEATNPVYERDYSPRVSLVDAPLEGDVVITPSVRTYEGGLQLLEDLEAELTDAVFELRVRDDVGGWAW